MYIDIVANANLKDAVMATFKETGPSRGLIAVRLWRAEHWQWCAVTGWEDDAPAMAWVTPIEESGDGPALLVHGSNHGLRLAEVAEPVKAHDVEWNLADAKQWGEPFLICRPD